MKYQNLSIKSYLTELAKDVPVPGGGSAACIVASLGVASIMMAVNFTKKKKQYTYYRKEIDSAIKDLSRYTKELEMLADKDALAYGMVAKAMKMESSDKRSRLLEASLKNAAGVPHRLCEICYKAIVLCEILAVKVNKNLITDIGCGVHFLYSAYLAGMLNVEINLKYMTDASYAKKIEKDIDSMWHKVEKMKVDILLKAQEIMYS